MLLWISRRKERRKIKVAGIYVGGVSVVASVCLGGISWSVKHTSPVVVVVLCYTTLLKFLLVYNYGVLD